MAMAVAAATSPDMVIGNWMTETRHGVVEITRCGASICGKLLTSDGIDTDPTKKDTNNKDPNLRGRLLKGVSMLGGFKLEDGVWNGGTVYNAEDGKTYEARITIVDPNTLKLRGCIFVPLCKNQTWTRVR
jgi:uncharacterized protein (DUF2147 family)